MVSVHRQVQCASVALACALVTAVSWAKWDSVREFSTRPIGPTDDSASPHWGLPFAAHELAGNGWYSFNLDTNAQWAVVVPGHGLKKRLDDAPVGYFVSPETLLGRPRWSLAHARLENGPGAQLAGWVWWPVGDGSWYGRDQTDR